MVKLLLRGAAAQVVRVARGAYIISVLLLSLIVGAATYHVAFMPMLWPFSSRLWRIFNLTFIDIWYVLLLFYMENWNKKKWVITGDIIPPQERAFIISNHPSELDWMCWWPVARRKGMIGNLKVILKKEICYVPFLGHGMDDLEFLFLERDWEKDKHIVKHRIESWKQDKFPLWLTFFPEGTDFSEAKHRLSIEYAKANGLSSYKNLLVPRVTGFIACLQTLGPESIDALYDFTLAYANSPRPTAVKALLDISPKDVHLHIRRYPIDTIPMDDPQKLKEWIFKCWQEKDELMEYFAEHQHFPVKDDDKNKAEESESSLKQPKLLWWWFAWWMILLSLLIYCLITTQRILVVVLLGNALHFVTTYSKRVRQWRGLSPPDKDHPKAD